jgi:regulator of CtrA degradation
MAPSQQLTHKLIDTLYIEALVLADEARTYFDEDCKSERGALAPEARVLFSCESIKVTTRLMHVITWLLNARADTGISIGQIAFVPPTPPHNLPALPETARALITTSQGLYDRVTRLDTQPLDISTISPARELIAQLGAAF